MFDFFNTVLAGLANSGAFLIARMKFLERGLLGLEDSYIELLTVLFLAFLSVLPVLAPPPRRQAWRHAAQITGIIIFVFIVYTCMGVFGMISNFFRGLSEIGRENIIALYFISVPLTILVTSLLFGPFFCGWICPTGSLQEFIGLLTRSWNQRLKAEKYPFSAGWLAGVLLITAIFFIWLWDISRNRVFFAEDATVYWSFIMLLILLLLTWRMSAWDMKFRRLKSLSFVVIIAAAILHIRITSPVHFGFAKVVDPASVLATVMVVLAALIIPRIWCRYLCPWRLAISWASRYSVRNIHYLPKKCTQCGQCSQACDVEAIANGIRNPAECNLCLRCVDTCPEKALLLQDQWSPADIKNCRSRLPEDSNGNS